MNREINTQLTSGIIGLLLTIVFYFALTDISWMSKLFPETMIYILGILSLILIVLGIIKPSRDRIFNVGSNIRWIVTGVLFFAWVLLMPVLGFFVATVLFMTIIVAYLAQARVQITLKKIMVWICVVLTEVTFFYMIFTKVLYVPLPEGMFF